MTGDRSVRLTVAADLAGFVQQMHRGEVAAQSFANRVAQAAASGTRALTQHREAAASVAKPLLAIGAAAALGVGYAVKSYADFDEKMSSVKSLSHATAGEMEQLKKAALTTGTAIGFSATQAADAEIELVKAGVSASNIYGGALAGSLKLAAAGQIDVADATSIAASTMVQFGLKGRDVGHVADLLAAGADKALGGVSDLGEGLKYIGPVAASAHVSLEQTVGSLALLAQNGILGEQAGTSLRGVLLSLTAPSKIAADTMAKYGVSVYDASGKFVGFDGVAEQLKKRIGGLDDATRDQALGQIFGNAQITAATILMNGGSAAVDKWTKSVNEQGFATEQAVGKMDNLNGDLTKLKASFQTAAIVTGEAANGPLRAAVQVVTDLLQTYSQAPGAVQGVVLGVGALTAAVALSSGALLIGIPKVVAFGVALRTLSTASIPGVSAAAGGALKGVGLLGKGLGATAGFLIGPWGIALGAAAAATAGLTIAADSGTVSQERLTNSLITSKHAMDTLELAGKRTSLSKFLVGDTSKELKDLPKVLHDLSSEGFSAGTILRVVGDNFASLVDSKKKYIAVAGLRQEAKSLEAYGQSLANLAAADAPAAAKAFSKLRTEQGLNRDQTLLALDNMKPYKAALIEQANSLGITTSKSNLLLLATGKYAQAAAKAKTPTTDHATALKDLEKSGEDAAKAIQQTSDALKQLTSPTLDARSAERDFQAAVDAVTQSLKDNGTSLDTTTDKGRANEAALDGIAQAAENSAGAIYSQTQSQDQATAAMQAGRDELIKALGQYGITGAAAQAYADKILGTPKDWATQFTAHTAGASASVTALSTQIQNMKGKTLYVDAATGQAQYQIDGLINKYNGRHLSIYVDAQGGKSVSVGGTTVSPRALATGGHVVGSGTGTSDSIPAWLSNGEFVLRAAAVQKYGTVLLKHMNEGQLTRQQIIAAATVRGYANGGPVAPVRYAPGPAQVVMVGATGTPTPTKNYTVDVKNYGRAVTGPDVVRALQQVESLT